MQFATKNSPKIDLDISYANRLISKAFDTKLLGIDIDSTLPWKNHGEQITHTHEGLLCSEIS
jgi:phosphopantetheinyl transferase